MDAPDWGAKRRRRITDRTPRGEQMVVLSCPGCGTVTQVPLGQGELTCGCGATRRILRFAEGAPEVPAGPE